MRLPSRRRMKVTSTSPQSSQSLGEDDALLEYKRRRWSPGEDDRLAQIIDQHGARRWSKISTLHGTRDGKQCRERWIYHIGPHVNKSAFSTEEMETLARLQALHGNKWSEISAQMPGRTASAIKNHWNTTMAKFHKQHGKALGKRDGRSKGEPKSYEMSTSSAESCDELLRSAAREESFEKMPRNRFCSALSGAVDACLGKSAPAPHLCGDSDFSHKKRARAPPVGRSNARLYLFGSHDESLLHVLRKQTGITFIALDFEDIEAAMNLAEYSSKITDENAAPGQSGKQVRINVVKLVSNN